MSELSIIQSASMISFLSMTIKRSITVPENALIDGTHVNTANSSQRGL